MDGNQIALLGAVAAPFAGCAAVLALHRHPDAREGASLAAAVAAFALAALLVPAALGGPVVSYVLGDLVGLRLELRADALGLLFATLASFLWILTTVYSVGYMRGKREHAQTRYYASFALVMGATMGVALAANLFSLFLFYEILTVATYPLVVHEETEAAFAAGRKYLVYTLSGGVAILAGMMVLQTVGGLDFVAGGNPAVAGLAPDLARMAFLLLFAGFGVKAALVPVHGWLPSAMVAPTPVSGLLHAVAVVKAGVFGLLRLLLFLYGPTLALGLGLREFVILAAVVTILVGSVLALVQDDLKLRLAYSTVSQLSYIVLGAAVFLPFGLEASLVGAAFGLAAHAFAKLTMFFVAGAVAVETGRTKVSQLDGLGRRMPWTFGAFAVASLSMVGLPPVAGFVSKQYLGIGAWAAGDAWILLVFFVAGALNVAYFLPILVRAYFRGPPAGGRDEPRRTLLAPLLATGAGALVLGLWTALPYGPFEMARAIAAGVSGLPAATEAAFPLPNLVALVATAALFPVVMFALKGRARELGLILLAGTALLAVLLRPDPSALEPYALGAELEIASVVVLAGAFLGVLAFEALRPRVVSAEPGAAARAVLAGAAGVQTAFGAVYDGAVASAHGLFAAGRRAMALEDRDVNWNLVAFGTALVLVLGLVLLGVSP